MCVFAHSGVQHILCCVFCLFLFVLCFVYPMLLVSLDYPFFIAPSVFSGVYLTAVNFPSLINWFHLQFEKHASQKQVVSFTTISPTLSLITACTCKVPITCLPASHARSCWIFELYKAYLRRLMYTKNHIISRRHTSCAIDQHWNSCILNMFLE